MKLVRCRIDDCGVWVVDTCMSWHAWTAHRRAIEPGYRRRYFTTENEGPPQKFEVPGTAPLPPPRQLLTRHRCKWGKCRRMTAFRLCAEHRARARGYVQKHRERAGA